METTARHRSTILFSIVGAIAILLLVNIVLIYQNSLLIEGNRKIQNDAEQAKINSLDIIRNIHLLDIGLRGYALVKNPAFLSTIDTAKSNRDLIFNRVRTALHNQHYPNMKAFDEVEDSVSGYFTLVDSMLQLIKAGKDNEFNSLLNQDKGYSIWLRWKNFSNDVNQFEDKIALKAKMNYKHALKNSYLLQALIFILSVPALVYMAYYASRAFRYSDELRKSQEEKNLILLDQNVRLDQLVKEKTEDILAQNEEISAQNEEIRSHNDQLISQQQVIEEARITIEEQASRIQLKNNDLQSEVDTQTKHLLHTNKELVEHNSRLEQFSYIISHNLRAPLARVQGLVSLLDNSQTAEEKSTIHQLLLRSSHELDMVITDLGMILSIQKSNTDIRSNVNLLNLINKVVKSLEPELHLIKASADVQVSPSENIQSLLPYVESIFYNLLSNAIKYRASNRPLSIGIRTNSTPHFLEVIISDNGLGIDLEKYNDQLFNLYKRFHLHVEGKGLGLYLVRTQIEALGGRIEVHSEVDVGTRFTLHFKKYL